MGREEGAGVRRVHHRGVTGVRVDLESARNRQVSQGGDMRRGVYDVVILLALWEHMRSVTHQKSNAFEQGERYISFLCNSSSIPHFS